MDEKGKSIAESIHGALFIVKDFKNGKAEAVAFVQDAVSGGRIIGRRPDGFLQLRPFFFELGQALYQGRGDIVRVFDSS
ncbi:MAG: hypothetical protein IKP86_08690 [Anaerolineaceae bacterium]|nr:hypothetical protein [Anaerolineaceae bacterium]